MAMTKEEFTENLINMVCKDGEDQPVATIRMMGNVLVGMGIGLLQQSGVACLDVVETIVAKWPQPVKDN